MVDPFTVGPPQQPPGHLRDAIRELRDYACDAVANRRTRDVWELARHLFTDTVFRALKLTKTKQYNFRDEERFVRERSLERSLRDISPHSGRRHEPEKPQLAPTSRKDLLLDEEDKRELEELKRPTAEDKRLVKHFEERAADRAEKEKRILLAAQISQDEARLRQKKLLKFGHSEERQISLVKVAQSTPPVSKSRKDVEPTAQSSRKRKAEAVQVLTPNEDELVISAAGDDYFDE